MNDLAGIQDLDADGNGKEDGAVVTSRKFGPSGSAFMMTNFPMKVQSTADGDNDTDVQSGD